MAAKKARKPMKMFPSGVIMYAAESGRVRTDKSLVTLKKVMGRLQRMYPENLSIADFTTDQLTAFCLAKTPDGRQPAAATVKQRKAYCRSTFAWWAYHGYCPENPASDLEFTVQPGGGERRTHTWLEEDQIGDIYRSFDGRNVVELRDRLVFLFGVSTGLRLFELTSLRWSMFSQDLSSVQVVRKGDKNVKVNIPRQLRDDLVEWRQRRPMGAEAVFPSFKWTWNPGEQKNVMIPLWDKPVGEEGLRQALRKVGERFGLRLRPHDLRRSFAGILFDKTGGNLKVVKEAMSHEHIATTDRYLKASPKAVKDAMDGLEFTL